MLVVLNLDILTWLIICCYLVKHPFKFASLDHQLYIASVTTRTVCRHIINCEISRI